MGLLSFINDWLDGDEDKLSEEEIERINVKIDALPSEKREEFWKQLDNLLEYKPWFQDHNMYYTNPNVQRVKEILYEEEFKKYAISN